MHQEWLQVLLVDHFLSILPQLIYLLYILMADVPCKTDIFLLISLLCKKSLMPEIMT